MLQAARRRKAEGVDVVVGVVETHGRRETAALLDELEIVPRRRVPYKGRLLEEMDLDALLARRPQLAIVDELAHDNAPDSRHPKRWMDVEELLAAGIDVWTTMNVQHVESLNDVVAQITRHPGARGRPGRGPGHEATSSSSTCRPMSFASGCTKARSMCREQARQALEHYFSTGNLTALRELSLRGRRSASTTRCSSTCAPMAWPGPGPRASGCWSACTAARAPPSSSATPRGWPTG